jgi:hypothetical protein
VRLAEIALNDELRDLSKVGGDDVRCGAERREDDVEFGQTRK